MEDYTGKPGNSFQRLDLDWDMDFEIMLPWLEAGKELHIVRENREGKFLICLGARIEVHREPLGALGKLLEDFCIMRKL